MPITTKVIGTKRIEYIQDTFGNYTARIYQDINTPFESLWITKRLRTLVGVKRWAESQVS